MIDAPIELVFDLSFRDRCAPASTVDSNERAIAGVTTGGIGLGQQVTWRAHLGVPFSMTSKITEHERPCRFVDQQTTGAFHSMCAGCPPQPPSPQSGGKGSCHRVQSGRSASRRRGQTALLAIVRVPDRHFGAMCRVDTPGVLDYT